MEASTSILRAIICWTNSVMYSAPPPPLAPPTSATLCNLVNKNPAKSSVTLRQFPAVGIKSLVPAVNHQLSLYVNQDPRGCRNLTRKEMVSDQVASTLWYIYSAVLFYLIYQLNLCSSWCVSSRCLVRLFRININVPNKRKCFLWSQKKPHGKGANNRERRSHADDLLRKRTITVPTNRRYKSTIVCRTRYYLYTLNLKFL